MTTPETTESETQSQPSPIPSVPQGTPGHDWRAGLPAAQPPGAQQPWRRLGPGNRGWVVAVTVIALVILGVASLFAVGIGSVSSAFTAKGVVVLDPSQFSATQRGCSGEGVASGVEEGGTITFQDGDTQFDAQLGPGTLKQGRCQVPFNLSTVDSSTSRTYSVTVGGVRGTPVSGDELMSGNTVVVYVAPR
ncbi:hypothetical protein [Tsukamurella strandjordii]|uniref:Uncharacterized protein n=1 Tax=Tsukamurella strandjordii TaxID=147577 RepID=A0AA90SRX4_9ACTN|nr:hypothetical protein [Tsukamurella strandjordii]MDP0399336.1 hypothetical protein [Tsukamurella strandjordii]